MVKNFIFNTLNLGHREKMQKLLILFFCFYFALSDDAVGAIRVGSEELLTDDYIHLLTGKKIGLITNHTAVTSQMVSTFDLLKKHAGSKGYTIQALFAPEHGIKGGTYAGEDVADDMHVEGIPIYSLHGKFQRPTDQMLKNINLLIYDIQDIGSRAYTYVTTLFYVMEEAAKRKIPVMVLDRPNPINGLTVDGPMLQDKWRSFLGYINVPYCHGMTVGELALFFNGEYDIGCKLEVIPMKGWRRWMNFADTGLAWIPTSPNIPEPSTALFYPTTGFMGELTLVNIGIGYTLPFKLVGAPWIQAEKFAEALNKQKFPGVHFEPFYYRPFYGKFAQEDCQGVLIVITKPNVFRPVTTQYMILGILKSLYPSQFKEAIDATKGRKEMFCKANGTEEVYKIMTEKKHIVWPLKMLHQKEREIFMGIRQKYLLSNYTD
jgi:uncharacterized protein YbbC (DUF1343 family)